MRLRGSLSPRLRKLVDQVGILCVLLGRNPHLSKDNMSASCSQIRWKAQTRRTFLNVARLARIEPPIQVEYFRSGGA